MRKQEVRRRKYYTLNNTTSNPLLYPVYTPDEGYNPCYERVLDFSLSEKLKVESGKLNPPNIVPPLDGEARRGSGKTLTTESRVQFIAPIMKGGATC